MNLGGRAALSIPLIALVVAISFGLFEVLTASEEYMFTSASLFLLVFSYTAILALFIGVVLAFPMVLFGGYLPRPRLVSLSLIGVVLSSAIAVLLSDGDVSIRAIIGMALMGLLSALLWWLFVERHREEGQFG